MSANKSVIKALKILELISKSSEGLTLSEIYKELDIPKATVYDILQALYAEDAVYYKNEIMKTYVIGSKLFSISQAYTKNSNFISFASPALVEFANKYNVATFACKRLGTKVTYVYKYESTKVRLNTLDIGVQTPLHESIPGLAFLAYLYDEKAKDLLNRILNKEFNGVKTTEYIELLNKIQKHKDKGYIIDNGLTDPFVCELAVPVYNFEGKMTGAIYATRLVMDEKTDDMNTYISDFVKIAQNISLKQGYQK